MTSVTFEEFTSMIRATVREELSQKEEKELLNFKEACQFLGVSASALNKWKRENLIPFKRLGKRVLFSRKDLNEALKDSNYLKFKKVAL